MLFTVFLASCSATKSVPEGSYLYTGAKVDMGEHKKLATKKLIDDVYSVIAPQPNDRIAGLPLRLYLYQLFDNGKEKGLLPWARDKIGQAPVLFQEEYPEKVERLIANRLFNNGYFQASVGSEVKMDNKKAGVTYFLKFEEPYRIDSISYRIDHPTVGPLLQSMPPSEVLESGDVYTLKGLQEEGERIEQFLKEQGYYFFEQDYLQWQVDSTNRNRTVNLRLLLREDAPPENLKVAYIRAIDVWPDYGSESQSGGKLYQEKEEDIHFLYWTKPKKLRPNSLLNHIFFRSGERYNLEYHHNTLKRLVNLSSLSFVNIAFNRPEYSDSLEMEVMLSPRIPQTIQASAGLSYKNSQYLGPELELTYINRNLFRGSENLRIRGFTNLNFPVGNTVGNFYENSGIEAELALPGLRLPWRQRQKRDLTLAKTHFNLKYERESTDLPMNDPILILLFIDNIPLPDLQEGLAQDSSYAPSIGVNSFKFTFGYQWQRRPDILHEFNPIGLGMQFDEEETPDLKILVSVALALGRDFQSLVALEDMVYWNPDYIFQYDSRNVEVKRHNFFYRGRLSLTGNKIITDKSFEALNVSKFESLFTQTENDFRYFYITPKKKHTFAARFIADLSIPLGEELFLPFLNLYTVGGPNSLRAYSLRELGPGILLPDDGANSLWLYAGKGDMHLESSLEFRYKLTSMFEVAAFADAGNVWLVKSSTEKANFKFNRFVKELGFGTGIGFRLNVNPLVLRLDLAIPLTKPWLPEGQRWVGNQIDLFSGAWRKENLQFNLSFGYPF